MGLRLIADYRLASGQLWHPELTLDLMHRDWQMFELPFDFYIDNMAIGPTVPPDYDPEIDTFDVTFVFPESWDKDDAYIEGMTVKLVVFFYLVSSEGSMSVSFQGETNVGAVVHGASGWRSCYKTYTTFPTGVVTETLELKINPRSFGGGPGLEYGTMVRDWGTGPDSYMQVVIPASVGIPSDPLYIEVNDESELPDVSDPATGAAWRGALALIKGGTGVQDEMRRCLKGYDDVYRWIPFVAGGGGL